MTQMPQMRIERLAAVNEEALAILEEYYEAVQVVVRDTPQAIQKMLDEPASGMWLAYVGDARPGEVLASEVPVGAVPVAEILAGCVALRKLNGIADAGECKRLYVRPEARGHHIADRLMDALEQFAQSAGIAVDLSRHTRRAEGGDRALRETRLPVLRAL